MVIHIPSDAAHLGAQLEIFDDHLARVWSMVVDPREQQTEFSPEPPLPPGLYLVRAEWSDGTDSRVTVEVGEDQAFSVSLTHPGAQGAHKVNRGSLLTLDTPDPDTPPTGVSFLGVIKPPAALALWQWAGDGWSPVVPAPVLDAGRWPVQLAPRQYLLELRGFAGPDTLMALPYGTSSIAVHADGDVDVLFEDDAITALTRFGARRRMDAVVALRQKQEHPIPAAAAGLFLAGERRSDIPEYWWENLSNIDFMADGAVARAWHLINTGQDVEVARDLLLEASKRGLPVLTLGITLLRDGLALFPEDPDCVAALRLLSPWLEALLHHSIWLRFAGTTPDLAADHGAAPEERLLTLPSIRTDRPLMLNLT